MLIGGRRRLLLTAVAGVAPWVQKQPRRLRRLGTELGQLAERSQTQRGAGRAKQPAWLLAAHFIDRRVVVAQKVDAAPLPLQQLGCLPKEFGRDVGIVATVDPGYGGQRGADEQCRG